MVGGRAMVVLVVTGRRGKGTAGVVMVELVRLGISTRK